MPQESIKEEMREHGGLQLPTFSLYNKQVKALESPQGAVGQPMAEMEFLLKSLCRGVIQGEKRS